MREQKGITLIALIITIIVMLILAGVSISLTIGENGVINQAEQANEKMTIAQIKERAELVKASLSLDLMSQKTTMVYSQEFLKRLRQELEGKIEGNSVVTKDGKYAVSLVGSDLEIIVTKYGEEVVQEGILTPDYLSSPTYEMNTENQIVIRPNLQNGDNLVAKIQEMMEKATLDEKEKGALEYFSHLDTWPGYKANTLDEVVVLTLKDNFGKNHDTLSAWKNDPEVKAFAVSKGLISANEELTDDHFYIYLFHATKEDVINDGYAGYINYCIAKPLNQAFNNKKLKITIKKDGKEYINDVEFNADTGYTIENPEDGFYEIIIEAVYNSFRFELVNEKIVVNN